ncbi:component of gems protein 1-like [Pogonomyrmex barbatus]|uniref:Component of gems protein 1-like n=1 Tax=Pogonomyrmex barbatus TaxID=144034 RepID=A0A8N1S522_9HYME|nr:component of gems protein 1-like [Pogonomyrmex barbatus]
MDHSATTRHTFHRHYNRNYCHHRHHQYHHCYHLHHHRYHHHHHHHQHICYCNHQYANVNQSKDKMLRDDNRYRSSFHFSVIFLNALSYSRYDDNNNDDDNDDDDNDDNANMNANVNVNDDGDDNNNANDAKYDNDSDEIFLTKDVLRFTVQGTPFASSYV